jgi:hypothetical protein
MRSDWRARPAPSRLDPRHPAYGVILARHERACDAGLSSYLDPASPYTVLTATYLADRGYCCDAGCRHCPWADA